MITIDYYDFIDFFDRGQFTYGDELPDVRPKDVDKAIEEAEAVFNHDLYPTEEIETQALLYLTAHFLQCDIDSSKSGGQPTFIQNSRSADGVSESVSIPDWMNEGEFSFYATTYYGQKWLMLSKPYTDGAVYSVPGGTSY